MKKYLIAIALMLTLGMTAEAAAQKHRHTTRTEQADITRQADAVEAFSDTTAVDTTYNDEETTNVDAHVSLSDEEVKSVIREVIDNISSDDVVAILIVFGVLFFLLVLFPIIILVGVVWLINRRNRREKIKLAQMAVQNGQPIPDGLLKEQGGNAGSDDYAIGMRQVFLGIGLMIFLGYTAGKIGFAIGALVFFIGLGKVVIAKTTGEKNSNIREIKDNSDNWDNNNN